jgi:hypothetical protein
MISDKQGREWLLQKLYDDGWKYYVKNVDNIAFVTTKRPVMDDDILDVNSGGHIKCINNISKIMPQIEQNEVLNIAEELGIIDWSKVAVDTPVLVRFFESTKWVKRHFAFFKNEKVYTWDGGLTSWTCDDLNDAMSWECAKLAETNKRNGTI